MTQIISRLDHLEVQFPYNAGLIAALKSSIPYTERRWDNSEKVWRVGTQHADTVRALIATYLNIQLPPVQVTTAASQLETQLLTLRYLGAVKDRGSDARTAFGHDGQDWKYIFPEPVLKTWFGLEDGRVNETATLYAVLGIRRDAPGVDIKRAFKSAARQWHPDACREPDAAEQFKRINAAYQILGDPALKARYDAGLALEASLTRQNSDNFAAFNAWKPPLRCGYVLANVRSTLGRLCVLEILQWTDIINALGQVLVSSWPMGADIYQEQWL